MADYVIPVLFAVVLWWSTTAAAIHVNGLARHTFHWTMAIATVLMVAAFGLLHAFGDDKSVTAAYVSFVCGVIYWSWQDVGFYLGLVTGWRKSRCPEGCSGWAHLRHAIEASIHHEIAILAAAAALFAILYDAPNQVGLWTFVILWGMHQSAKLNVFLGVSNLNTEFLPEHLRFLESFFRKRPMNLLFPVSVTVSTIATVWLATRAADAAPGSFEAVGNTLLATLMALGLLEHWFLVLPMPAEKLWRWAIAGGTDRAHCRVDIVAGTLGAGKTTYLKRLLDRVPAGTRSVVVANDFGELGIDAALLSQRGADVIELANGCICCSLKQNLATEIAEITRRWRPERLFVEPSGVADVGSLVAVMAQPGVLPERSAVHLHAIFDASRLLSDFAAQERQIAAQARLAETLIINKSDLVGTAELEIVAETLRSIAPTAQIYRASRGLILGAVAEPGEHRKPPARPAASSTPSPRHVHDERQSWSAALAQPCGMEELGRLLRSVASGGYGNVERLKGIAETTAGWVHFDIAGGRPSIAAFAPRDREQPRVMAIGTDVDTARLAAAFNACRSGAAS